MAKPAAGHTGGSGWERSIKKRGEGRGKKGSNLPYFFFRLVSPPSPSVPSSLSLSFCLSLPPPSSTPYGRQSRSKDDRPILLFRFICRSETLLFRIVARFNGLIYFARFSLANRLDPVDHWSFLLSSFLFFFFPLVSRAGPLPPLSPVHSGDAWENLNRFFDFRLSKGSFWRKLDPSWNSGIRSSYSDACREICRFLCKNVRFNISFLFFFFFCRIFEQLFFTK